MNPARDDDGPISEPTELVSAARQRQIARKETTRANTNTVLNVWATRLLLSFAPLWCRTNRYRIRLDDRPLPCIALYCFVIRTSS